ncbi:MAG TPA: helix-turn-helix domain-containing protein [Caulobacteraceae bacterium]|nr:helix-turn-helix domain-containing protein [Caulobacteraceae bacterium]
MAASFDPPIETECPTPAAAWAGVRMSYDRDEEIFGEGEPARNVYMVVSGAVRTYRVLADGRRQIVEFHLAGDVFGFDGDPTHNLTAEAIGEVTLQVMRRTAFFETDRPDAPGAGHAWATLLRKLQRAEAHVIMLGRQSACERVASFLLDMRGRMIRAGFDGDGISLPMTRQDIADYLGLTIETVSRTFSQLQVSGMIELPSRRSVVVRNLAAMDRICA